MEQSTDKSQDNVDYRSLLAFLSSRIKQVNTDPEIKRCPLVPKEFKIGIGCEHPELRALLSSNCCEKLESGDCAIAKISRELGSDFYQRLMKKGPMDGPRDELSLLIEFTSLLERYENEQHRQKK
jgi:hypothetical protein